MESLLTLQGQSQKAETLQKFKVLSRADTQIFLFIITPHYRSDGRQQVSGGLFGGSMALSEDYRDKCHNMIVSSYL